MSFAPPSLADIVRALYGVWLIFVRDTRAVTLLDTSIQGFWASFFAAALALPANVLIVMVDTDLDLSVGLWELILVVQIYVVMVLAYPLAVLFLTQVFDRDDRFVAYVVAHNWASLPIAYLYVFVMFALAGDGAIGPEWLLDLVTLAVHGAILYLLWRVARYTLDLSEVQAVLVVVFELFVTWILFRSLTLMASW